MKKFAFAAMLALAAGMITFPAVADSHEDGEKKFTVHGEVRTRWEYLENVNDFTDTAANGDFNDDVSFLPYRARVSVHGQFTRNVEGAIEIQNAGTFGNEDPQRGFQDPIAQNFGNIDDGEIDLYQAYVRMNEVGGSGLYLQVGRQEQTFGSELLIGDNDYYNGLVFDGVLGGWNYESWDLQIGAFTIEDRVFGDFADCIDFGDPEDSDCVDDNITFYTATADFGIGDAGQTLQPYILYYRDAQGGPNGIKTYTVGIRWAKEVGMDSDALIDWNLEVAGQSGDIDPNGLDVSHQGSIAEGWIGFNFNHGDSNRSRVFAGFLSTSGDDNPGDGDADGFFPLFGDIHANNRLGNLDLGGASVLTGFDTGGLGESSGITDVNIGYNGTYGNHMVLLALHALAATEDSQLGGEDDIGQEIDLAYGYAYSKNLSFGVEVSMFSPGDLLEAQGLSDDVLRVAAQARLRF